MNVTILGGAGFVGLTIAEASLAKGFRVRLLDRAPPPPSHRRALTLPDAVAVTVADVADPRALAEAIPFGTDAVVLAAAVTPDARREAADPAGILSVNLDALVPALARCREAGVRRVINLSSAAAYGAASADPSIDLLEETAPAEPVTLYAVTKFASERVLARLGALWGLDGVSVRLSAVFGPFERATGVRDTLSPQAQIVAAAARGEAALLPREGWRDWLYAPDAAEAVTRLIAAPRLCHALYNVSSPEVWPVLAWGERLAMSRPGFVCRLARNGETPTIQLHGDADRPPLATGRLADELGWRAAYGLDASVDDLLRWQRRLEAAA